MAKKTGQWMSSFEWAFRQQNWSVEDIFQYLNEKYEGVTMEEVVQKHKNKVAAKLVAEESERVREKAYENIELFFVEDNKDIYLVESLGSRALYQYKDGYYERMSDDLLFDTVYLYMGQKGVMQERTSVRNVRDVIRRIMTAIAQTPERVINKELALEKQPHRINLKNGLLDPKTQILHPHTPEHYSENQVPINYHPKATAPEFEKFIDTVSNNNEQTRTMLQDMFGYCLCEKGNPRHKIFLLYGPTARNGKSTTAKIISHLVGSINVSTLSLQQLTSDNPHATTSIVGKQLNISDEVDSRSIESVRFVSMSAEGVVTINPKNKTPFDYKVTAKFIITCNDLPSFKSAQGMQHRSVIIPFDNKIPEESRIMRYEERLVENEAMGILNWALAGYRHLSDRGYFFVSTRSAEEVLENKETSNTLEAFLNDNCTFYEDTSTDGYFCEVKELYGWGSDIEMASGCYLKYCMSTRTHPLSYKNFCKQLKTYAADTKKIVYTKKEKGVTVYGITCEGVNHESATEKYENF